MKLYKETSHFEITTAEQTAENFRKRGKQEVTIQYNQRTDMFDVRYLIINKKGK